MSTRSRDQTTPCRQRSQPARLLPASGQSGGAADEAQRAALIESVRTLHAASPALLRQLAEAAAGSSHGLAANVITGGLAGLGLMPGAGG